MRAITRPLLALLVFALLSGAACSGSGDDDDGATSPPPNPTDAPSKAFSLNGSGFQVAHIGETAFVRVYATASTSNVFCGESAPISNAGIFSVSSLPAAVLTTNVSYTIELFANVNGGSGQFDPFTTANPDHIYKLSLGPLAPEDADVLIDFPHGVQTPPNEFAWPPGTACP